MKKLFIFLLTGAVVAGAAYASSYSTEWRPVSGSRIIYNVMKRPWLQSTAEQAAEMAAQRCGAEVEELQRKGLTVLSFRGTGSPTNSPYMFAGNCDVQVLSR